MKQLLCMEGITKRFPGVVALNEASLCVGEGEIHALLGENGAGKSTLMKILSGAYTRDAGTITFDGTPISGYSPRKAQEMGISTIYQELNLVPHLTVAENIFISDLPVNKLGRVNWKAMHKNAQELLDSFGAGISSFSIIRDLGVAQQQMVEVAKAISQKAKIIIMDEPTAPLTKHETGILFEIIRKLKAENVSIIYISHRLEEIKEICERATIMRDGCTVFAGDVSDMSLDFIIRQMVGREMKEQFPKETISIGGPIFRVENLNCGNVLHNISFSLNAGEVLGIGGLVGAGRTETARAIFGIDIPDSGEMFVKGKRVQIKSPKDAIANGIGFVTEDRKGQGLVPMRSCTENIALPALDHFMRMTGLDLRREKQECAQYVRQLNIKTPSLDQKVRNLSGGNQQKVVLAKWLISNCDILILDEPTRGIDVGAKYEVYNIINAMARQGKAIIMISSEMPELLGMCDRIVIMHGGSITGEMDRGEATQSRLMYYAAGGDKLKGAADFHEFI